MVQCANPWRRSRSDLLLFAHVFTWKTRKWTSCVQWPLAADDDVVSSDLVFLYTVFTALVLRFWAKDICWLFVNALALSVEVYCCISSAFCLGFLLTCCIKLNMMSETKILSSRVDLCNYQEKMYAAHVMALVVMDSKREMVVKYIPYISLESQGFGLWKNKCI